MQNSKSILDHFFNKTSRIKIPVYQRNYGWKKENCDRLFRDVEENIRHLGTDRKHFFGTIIYIIGLNDEKRCIIDGQQRIITTALLLAAMRDLLNSGDIDSQDPGLASNIDSMLVDKNLQAFIEPAKGDVKAYRAIILGKPGDYVKGSNLQNNYELFKRMLRRLRGDITVDKFFESIRQFRVMIIRLDNNDDAQAVFECINSTGLRLNEGDKIRNFLLMNLELETLDELYDGYWTKIEDNAKNLSAFFKDYLTAMEGKAPVSDRVYLSFQEYASDKVADIRAFFEELLGYSEIYRDILNHDLGTLSTRASRIMLRINHLGYTVSYPFLMRVLDAQRSGKMSASEAESILEAVESYLLRRAICDVHTNALKSVFNPLYREIEESDVYENAADRLKYILLQKTGGSRYPRDPEVMEKLSNLDIYGYKNNKLCSCMLSILNYRNKDSEDVLPRISSGSPNSLTIEHVMPQNLTNEWRAELGERYAEVHDEWLHRLGNLTLTSYNSEFGCRSFAEKKKFRPGGLDESDLYLNRYFEKIDRWDESAIEKRNQELVEDFVKRMPELKLSSPSAKDMLLTMDMDPEIFTRFEVRGYSFRGILHLGYNGAEAMIGLMRELYNCNPRGMFDSDKNEVASVLGKKVRYGNAGDRSYKEFVPGLYVLTAINQQEKVRFLRKTAKLQGIDPSELAFIGQRSANEMTE